VLRLLLLSVPVLHCARPLAIASSFSRKKEKGSLMRCIASAKEGGGGKSHR
jgi:hypothetical protein